MILVSAVKTQLSSGWEAGSWGLWLSLPLHSDNSERAAGILHPTTASSVVPYVVSCSQVLLSPTLLTQFSISQSSHKCLNHLVCHLFLTGEKPGAEQDEVKLQNASKQIVQTAILQAVQQVSRENQQKEKRTNSSMSLQLERGKLTKKHEKK